MNKIITVLVLALTVTFSYGQKSAEKVAAANTKEMVKVLSLDADQEAKINEINVVKNTKLIANKAKEQSEDEMKANQKEIFVEAGKKFREILGLDKMKEWWAYQDEKKAKREKKN